MKHKKSFDHLEKFNINNSSQWVLVRGKNIDAPLLIHVQQGPGLPMISEATETEKRLRLEDKFLVAYWDQRGCGKSFSKDILPESINLEQMADDLIVCTKYLLEKYGKDKAVIVGYSIGATISLMAAAKDSSIFIITTQGKLIRIEAEQIRATGRSAQGVKLIDISENVEVASASLVERQADQFDEIATVPEGGVDVN